ncbi:hypothetical protein B0H19DRAFT_714238 [Mycena capillaripes]|nr:hypothetical protein B0H19DRAFT_714238 [Mycena capillaripes]
MMPDTPVAIPDNPVASPPTLANVSESTGPPVIVHCVLMLDEIVVEQRPCWDAKTNNVAGPCREHRVCFS